MPKQASTLNSAYTLTAFGHSSMVLPVSVQLVAPSAGKQAQLIVYFDTSALGAHNPLTALSASAAMHASADSRADYLWESTCFELFIQPMDGANSQEYVEINIAPTGQWNAYHFKSYRQPNTMPPPRLAANIQLSARFSASEVSLDIWLESLGLSDATQYKVGVSAIVPNTQAQASAASVYYFALQHSQPQADFHHSDDWLIAIQQR